MTSKHFPSKPDHIPELDGLRGLAILAVLFYHFFWFPSDPTHWPKFFSLLWKLGQIGWVGVNLFFVLSGFLITRILLAQKGSHSFFKDFYWRRALRILPLYFLTLLFIGFYYPSSGPFVLFSLFFLSNAVELWGVYSPYQPLWSLAVEEQFYLFWPWMVSKLSTRHLKMLCWGALCLEPVARYFYFMNHPPNYWLLLINFDGFAIGALLAAELKTDRSAKSRWPTYFQYLGLTVLLCSCLFKLGLFTRTRVVGEMFLPTVIYLMSASLLSFCIHFKGSKWLSIFSKGTLPSWGKLSYAAYLCHYPINGWIEQVLSHHYTLKEYNYLWSVSLLRTILCFGTTYGLSWGLHRFVELPFLRLKDRLPKCDFIGRAARTHD